MGARAGTARSTTRRRCSKYKPLANCHRSSLGLRQKRPRKFPGVRIISKTAGLRTKMLARCSSQFIPRKSHLQTGAQFIRRAVSGLFPKMDISFTSEVSPGWIDVPDIVHWGTRIVSSFNEGPSSEVRRRSTNILSIGSTPGELHVGERSGHRSPMRDPENERSELSSVEIKNLS